MFRATRALFLILLAASACGFATKCQEAVPIPVEAAVRVKKFADGTSVALSPKGNWLAYTVQDVEKAKPLDLDTYIRTGISPLASGTDIWVEEIGKTAARNLTSGIGDNWSPRWSPDGRYLAFFSDRDGSERARLWLWDTNKDELRRISDIDVSGEGLEWTRNSRGLLATSRAGEHDQTVSSPRKSGSTDQLQHPDGPPSSKVLIYKSDHQTAGAKQEPRSDPWNLDLYRMDVVLVSIDHDDSEIIVHGKRIASYRLSPDGSRIAYTMPKNFEKPGSQQVLFDLVVVDVATKQDKVLAKDIRFHFDGAAFSWSPDGQRLTYQTGGTEERNYDCYVVDVQTGATRNVTLLPTTKYLSILKYGAPTWDTNGESIYFLRDGTIWRASCTAKKAQLVGQIKDRQITQIITIAGGLPWRPGGNEETVVVTHDENGKQDGFYKFDLTTGQSKKLLEKGQCYRCANSQTHFLVAAGGTRIVYFAEDAEHDADLWINDAAFENPQRLTHLNRQFDEYRTGAARLIHWLGDNGEPLQGALLFPSNFLEGERYPLIVWVYGGSLLSNQFDRFGLAYSGVLNMQLLATRGYAVLLPDAPLHVGTPMFDLATTVLPGINKVIEMGIADPERLGVMGLSYGGYSTLGLIAQTTRFKAAVEIDGMGDYMGFYGEMDKNGSAFGTSLSERGQGVGWMGGTPWQVRNRYIDNSPVYYLDRIETPLLIVHGANDPTVAPFLGDQIFVGLRRLGKEVVYAKYEGEGHSPLNWSYADQVDFCNRMIDWFDLHLGKSRSGETVEPAK